MLHSVFERSLRDQRRSLIGWALGSAAYVAFVLAMWPAIRDNHDLQRIVQNYPETLRKMFGITEMSTATGYLGAELFSLMVPLLVIIYAVLNGGDTTAGEEDRKTIDLLLANPVSRTRVVLEESLSVGVGAMILTAAIDIAIVIPGLLMAMHLPYRRLLETSAAIVLVAWVFGAAAVVIGAWTGRRGLARGVGGALAAAAYLISSLASLVPAVKPWRVLSPYYHAVGIDPLRHGVGVGHAALLAAVTAVLMVAATWLFNRRDLST